MNAGPLPAVPVIAVVGPTGAGKSAMAVFLAREIHGVVVNADSRQTYRDFPIITAQPDARDAAAAPHRLYGFLPCEEKLGAGAYAALAKKEIADARKEDAIPIVTGGSGLYLQTLFGGIAFIPPVDPAAAEHWRRRCAEKGAPALHALLAASDPQTAARLHPNDSQRITRALEVLESSGKPLSHWHSLPVAPSPYRTLTLYVGLPLDALTPGLAARIDVMLENGAEEEARAAMNVCADPEAPGWSGIGCAELHAFLSGKISMDQCKEAWLHNTRAYAKRQTTWFKRDKSLVRVAPGAFHEAAALCREFLKTFSRQRGAPPG